MPISVGSLLVADLIPLVGVLFLGWSASTILVSYWLENGVVGLINVPKILIAGRGTPHAPKSGTAVATAAFFIVHYGIFWLVHGVFVLVLVGFGQVFTDGSSTYSTGVDGQTVTLISVLLLISHGTSFIVNYVGRGEFQRTTPAAQMFQPYGRLFILHVTIVLGFFAVLFLGQPIVLVALLVVLKTIGDLILHLREHGKLLMSVEVQGPSPLA